MPFLRDSRTRNMHGESLDIPGITFSHYYSTDKKRNGMHAMNVKYRLILYIRNEHERIQAEYKLFYVVIDNL